LEGISVPPALDERNHRGPRVVRIPSLLNRLCIGPHRSGALAQFPYRQITEATRGHRWGLRVEYQADQRRTWVVLVDEDEDVLGGASG